MSRQGSVIGIQDYAISLEDHDANSYQTVGNLKIIQYTAYTVIKQLHCDMI
jgi:hypothetical protein